MKYNTDTVIVGTGVSGRFAALNLPEDIKYCGSEIFPFSSGSSLFHFSTPAL